jgi:hypothetical protein
VLGLTQITVGRTTCAMRGSKIADLAGGFAVGENVTVDCVDGSLRSIVLARDTSGPSHSDSIVGTVKGESAPLQPSGAGDAAPACGVGKNILTWTSGTTGSRSVTGTICVNGTVTAVSPDGITVGDQTCPFVNGTNPLSRPGSGDVQVGEQAIMGCTVFSNGQSTGTIIRLS